MSGDKSALFLTYWNKFYLDIFGPPRLPVPVPEHRFAPPRRWRFDWAFMAAKLAVEIDGGQWLPNGGRHMRDADRDKLNHAAALGWRVMHFSPQQLERDPAGCIELVVQALEAKA